MAVDFLESAGGSYEFDRQAGAWSQPNGSNRPHLRLYERNSLNSLQTPQSPVAGNSDFGCWSPASNPEEDGGPKPVWSNGYDGWMQNSSSEVGFLRGLLGCLELRNYFIIFKIGSELPFDLFNLLPNTFCVYSFFPATRQILIIPNFCTPFIMYFTILFQAH